MSLEVKQPDKLYEIVCDISSLEDRLFIPDAYIARKNKEGKLTYIEKKATRQTISGYGFDSVGPLGELLKIIELISEENLLKLYNPHKRRKTTLFQLLNDRAIFKKISQYIDYQLDKFLKIVTTHQFPLCLGIERKAYLQDLLIRYNPHPPIPRLFFKKTEDKVLYRFWFEEPDGQSWHVSEKEVIPLTNQPAWLLKGYELLQVPHINGHLVKPFRTKDEIPIPSGSVKDYFEQFIRKIAQKVDIDAEGFKINRYEFPEVIQVGLTNHFIDNKWMLELGFHYTGAFFVYQRGERKRSRMDFQENGDICLNQILRNQQEEQKAAVLLQSFDLKHEGGGHFFVSEDSENPHVMIEWLIGHKKDLERVGFKVVPPTLAKGILLLDQPQLTLSAIQENDWFDLHGEVQIAGFEIPFYKIARYIASGKNFFPLPDGRQFLIPEAWFHKYKEVAQIGKIADGHIQIARSQFTLLQKTGDIELDSAAQELVEASPELTDFKLSSLLKAELRPYQLEGVKWLAGLYHKELGACLADDMGLGKTIQTLAILLYAKERKKKEDTNVQQEGQLNLFRQAVEEQVNTPLQALIVMPASLVFNWHNEILKFAPQITVYRHTGSKRHKDINLLSRFDIILTTYQTALRDVEILEKMSYEYIVLDESQQIKNKNSKIFAAVNSLEAKHKISLSGTPIENSLSDLWAQMQFINPNLLGTYHFFQKKFIYPIERLRDEEVTERLRGLIKPYLLRRTKEMVARDLPELDTRIFYSEMSPEQKKMYEKEKSAVRNYLFDNYAPSDLGYKNIVLQALSKLRQIANHPALIKPDYSKRSGKFDDIFEQLDVVIRGNHKVLIFSSFVSYLELFAQKLGSMSLSYAWLSGKNSPAQREAAINSFEKNQSVKIFLISLKAGGSGLNLTAADYVFIADPWWNPAAENQAIARAHRIGQTNPVFATKFITKDTIEDKILRLQSKKSKLFQDIVEGHTKLQFTKQELSYLLD